MPGGANVPRQKNPDSTFRKLPVELVQASVVPLSPYFTRRDWSSFWITMLLSFSVYLFTLSPDVSMDDSGEMLTAAYHLGVPHPPGYPIWTISAFLFEHLIPFGNAAWKVNIMSAFYSSLATGMLCLITCKLASRLWSIERLKDLSIPGVALEDLAQMAGIVAGLVFAFIGTRWSQAVMAKGVYALNSFFFTAICLMSLRWLHAPQQWRWPCLMALCFGMGITNHQTLLVNSLAFLFVIYLASRPLCRDTALLASIASGIFSWQSGLKFLPWIAVMLLFIYLFLMFTEPDSWSFRSLFTLVFSLFLGGAAILGLLWMDSPMENVLKWLALNQAPSIWFFLSVLLFAAWLILLLYDLAGKGKALRAAAPFFLSLLMFAAGSSFYAYMPLSSATNPPMNWGYTRTLEGFQHHITRGQYERIHPSTDVTRWPEQYRAFFDDLQNNFTLPLVFLGSLTLSWFFKFPEKEREYLGFTVLCFFFMGFFLVFLLNPKLDLESLFTNRVFYGLAYGAYAIWIGMGTIILVSLAQHTRNFLVLVSFGAIMALLAVLGWLLNKPWISIPGSFSAAAFYFLGLGLILKLPRPRIPLLITLYALPLLPLQANWRGSEMRGHDFGWRYGHDMLKNLDRNAVVYGGTDPGRFVPTYMIFVDSFQPARWRRDPTFDRRDLYIITQNALADHTYMNYIRDQYDVNRPKMDRWYHRLLGRDKDYPQEPLRLPHEQEFNDIFNGVAQAAFKDKNTDGFSFEKDASGRGFRASVVGAQAVFLINGAMAQWIFEHNKDKHTFYVEESYPIPWMYDYMEPAGLIMKLNREPIKTMDPKVVRRDMVYWKKLIAELLANPAFLRDDLARKSFSKLRSSIGGLYLHHGMEIEAEKALLESLELYPSSGEGRSRLVGFYLNKKRTDDALDLCKEWIRLDPHNPVTFTTRDEILGFKGLVQHEKEFAAHYEYNKKDMDFVFAYALILYQLGKQPECDKIIETFLDQDSVPTNPVGWQKAVSFYAQFDRLDRVEAIFRRWADHDPKNGAVWYSLARLQAVISKGTDAMKNLEKAIQLDPVWREKAQGDPNFNAMHFLPQFQKLMEGPMVPPPYHSKESKM